MFPGLENETWTHDEQAHAWYRHRFYRFEPDLNTDYPAGREKIRKVALFWVRLGVTGFRIDEVLSQAGDVLTGPHGEASEKCRHDIDVSVWRCALVPAATTDKERVPVNGGMLFVLLRHRSGYMDRAVGGDPPGTAAGPDAGADPKCARCPARADITDARTCLPRDARACATASPLLPTRPRLPSRPSAIQPRPRRPSPPYWPRHRVQPPPAVAQARHLRPTSGSVIETARS